MAHCISNPKGTVETNKNSILHEQLKKLFPSKRHENVEKGSVFYDNLFNPEFVKFFGQWFVDENIPGSKQESERLYNNNPEIFNEQGEPALRGPFNNESWFSNSKGERFPLNKNYLSATDRLETINSLSLLYLEDRRFSVNEFVKETLEKRAKELEEKYIELDTQIEENKDLTEDEIIAIENEQFLINESKIAIEKNILSEDSKENFELIVSAMKANLADFQLKYIDDAAAKEDTDPETNDEISNFTKEASEVRDTNNIDSELKAIISSIQDYNVDIDNTETPKYSNILQKPMARPANEVKNLLVSILSNIIEVQLSGSDYISNPYDLMYNKLKDYYNDTGDIIVRDFISKIDKIYNTKSANDKEAFKTKFVTSFYKAQNVFTITEISEDNNGKLTIRHIDPASTQDKEAFISNEISRNIINKFSLNKKENKLNNEDIYTKASEKLRNFKTKKDIIEGFALLDINLQPKTIDNLFKKKDNILQGINLNKKSLKQLLQELFNQDISYYESTDNNKKVKVEGLKNILREYHKQDLSTQKNILNSLHDRDELTPFALIAKYEAINKTELSDSSLFVGNKQRWQYSLISGLNKEILTWKAGNINSLLKKKNKNLTKVNYLLAQDLVDNKIYLENSRDHLQERKRRIDNLKLIINSELKKPNDPDPIQHKEIGEADLHMDIYFKMFNHKDEIYQTLEKQQSIAKQMRNASDTKVINTFSISADKSTSYGMKGFPAMTNSVVLDDKKNLISLGEENQQILKNYLLGEYNDIKANSKLIQGYLNKRTKAEKLNYAMQYLIPDFHYATKLKLADDTTISFSEESNIDPRLFNAGTWNKFGFFNSTYLNNKQEFDLLFKNESGVMIADDNMESHINNTLYKFLEQDIISIAEDNKKYFDEMIVVDKNDSVKSLFQLDTNISGTNNPETPYNYTVNSIFVNYELFSLFNGDLAFYKQKGNNISMEDALKRGPAVLTDGLYIRPNEKSNIQDYKTFTNKTLKVDKNTQATTAVLNVIESDTSKFIDSIRKATGNQGLSYAHEVADAQGFITLDFYKRILQGTYGWQDTDEDYFKSLQDPKHKITKNDIKWLKSAGKSLQALKLTGFNLEDILNESGDVIGQNPVYLKYSVAVLAPAIIGGTELQKLSDAMAKQNVDQVVFKSGSKASNKQATTIHNEENGIFTSLKEDMRLNPFIFNLGGLKLQVELPTKFDKEGVLGNQHLKNLLANLDLNSTDKNYEFRGNYYTAKELYDLYTNNIITNLQFQLDGIVESLEINNDLRTFNPDKLRKLIIKQLDINSDSDLIEILRDSSLPLEAIPGIAQRAFPIISSHVHKNIGKILTNAGSAIQVANIGFDRISNEDENNAIYLSEDRELRPPLPQTDKDGNILYFDEKGNVTTKELGKSRIQNARIMLPFSSVYKETGLSYEELKKAIADKKIDLRIFDKIIGYRIPNQSISSNDAIEVVGILPPNMGDTAIVYHEITAKTGSDFDIDKMYLMMPNFSYDKNTKEIKYIDDNSRLGTQNQLIELMQSILKSPVTYDDLMSPLDSDIIKDSINENLYLKTIVNDEEQYKKYKSLSKENKNKDIKIFASERKLNPLQQLSPKYMVKSRVDMLKAKALVATMANHMTDIPMSQIVNQVLKYDIGIEADNFSNIFVKGFENNNEYKLTKIVSYLMNAAVDAAKDNYIIEGNFNSYTANAAMAMIRMGIEPVNVFKVLLNDDILALSKTKQMQTQKISDINDTENTQEKLNEKSKAFVNYIQSNNNKLDFNDFIKENESFTSDLILGFWNIVQIVGKELNNDIVSSKSDSNGAGKNVYEHIGLYNRLERLSKESIGSNINNNLVRGLKLFKEGLDLNKLEFTTNIKNSDFTFLGAMMNNSLFLTNFLTRKMFVEASDDYRYITNRISNQLGSPLPTDASSIKLIANYIYPYMLSQSGHKLYNMDETEVSYLQTEFLKEVIAKKAGNPNNRFLKEIYIDTNTNLISFPNYRYFDTNGKILLKEALENIYKQTDRNNNQTGINFINKLVKYAFLTTGFKQTMFAMNEYLPKTYFLNTGHGYYINKLIDRLNNSSEFVEDESLKNIMSFMAINNDTNYKIVKKLYKTDGLVSNKALTYSKTLSSVKIKGTDNFFPFIKDNKSQQLFMLSDIETKADEKGILTKYPVYNTIKSNSEEVDKDSMLRFKTKVKLFNLNTIKQDNLFIGAHTNNSLFIQPEVIYTSELSNIFENNNLTALNDDINLQKENNMKNNKEEISQIEDILKQKEDESKNCNK